MSNADLDIKSSSVGCWGYHIIAPDHTVSVSGYTMQCCLRGERGATNCYG
jgi:hypothetical protein